MNSTRHTTYTYFEKDNDIIISHCQCTHSSVLFACVCMCCVIHVTNEYIFISVYNLFSSSGLPIKAFAFFYGIFSLLACVSVCLLMCVYVCECIPSFLTDSLFLYVSIFIALLLSFTVSLSLNIPSLMQNKKEHFGYFVVLYVFFLSFRVVCVGFFPIIIYVCLVGAVLREKAPSAAPIHLYTYTTLLLFSFTLLTLCAYVCILKTETCAQINGCKTKK